MIIFSSTRCFLSTLISLFILIHAPLVFAVDEIGQVVWVKGALKAMQEDKSERMLKRRSPVFLKDTLITDAKSTAQIVFTDNSVLALKENTTLVLSQYKHATKGDTSSDTFVADIAKGGFRTITGAIPKNNPEGYKANTPVATIGVSGTQYVLYYNANGRKLDTLIISGSISLSNAQGSLTLTSSRCKKIAECFKVATVKEGGAPQGSNKIPSSLTNFPAFQDTSLLTGIPSPSGMNLSIPDVITSTTPPESVSSFSINQPCN